jgi:hypothetical protein
MGIYFSLWKIIVFINLKLFANHFFKDCASGYFPLVSKDNDHMSHGNNGYFPLVSKDNEHMSYGNNDACWKGGIMDKHDGLVTYKG